MFGLTIEKLFVVAVIAAVLIGPRRLAQYASMIADRVRDLRAFLDTARVRAREETGVDVGDTDWRSLDPRRYDPRSIVRQALLEPAAPAADQEPAPARSSGRWAVVGSSGHPRRVWVPDAPAQDAGEAVSPIEAVDRAGSAGAGEPAGPVDAAGASGAAEAAVPVGARGA